MDRRQLTALVDRLLGVDAQAATLLTLAQELQASGNDRLKTFGSNLHRHARGVQVSAAAIRQELHHST